MEISSMLRSGINSLLGGDTANGGNAGASVVNRSNNAHDSGINFAGNESKSSISFGADGGGGVAAGSGFGAGGDVEGRPWDWFKRLLEELGLSSGDYSGGGGGGGSGGSGGGPAPAPRPGPAPSPGIDQSPTFKSDSASANLESYDPAKPTKRDSKLTDEQITTGFVQGQEGNCATVSGIKALFKAAGTDDPEKLNKSVEKTEGGYKVVQMDGEEVNLTDAELETAKKAANFNGSDKEMVKNATFEFALAAKRAQKEHNDGAATFEQGLQSLNNGDYSDAGLKRLGLEDYISKGSAADLASGQVGTIDRDGHAVAVMSGREELYGTKGAVPTHGDATLLSKTKVR